METQWRIELLGGLRATHGDQVLTRFGTQKNAALLAYLAYFRRSHRRDELVELLWPESDPRAGRNSLKQALSSLRQLLEQPDDPAGSVLVADRATVDLDGLTVSTDVAEFKAALRDAERREEGQEQTEALARGVQRYRGELLPGFFDDWVLQERQWLAESYHEALGRLLALLERTGDFARALEIARQGVSADPLREEAHRDLIRLYAAVGQHSAALRQYQELERLLKEQLDAAPEPATRALIREIERLSVLRSQPPAASAQVIRSSPHQVISPNGGENRLVTVLFIDMSHSVQRTADLAPEDAALLVNRLLTAIVDVVLKYDGRVDRFLGDGALTVFGALQAHEDDPERAIRAAMEIREAAAHLGLQITAGINTGEVYAGAVGSERHQEMSVVGPVVNLASRLQGQAEPGQILVGEVTYQQTRGAFEFSAHSLAIRGLAQPVAAYVVEQARTRPRKLRGIEGLRAALIGRDEELAKLSKALEAVLGGQGQMVSLIGEAGVGKSRLIAELNQGVGSRVPGVGPDPSLPTSDTLLSAPLWLEGRCLELGMTAGYSLFVDLFRDYFAWTPDEDDRARGDRIAVCLREFAGWGALSGQQAEEIGPLLGNLLSARFGTDWDERLKNASPEQIRYQTFMAVRDFFVALAHRQPVVLVCEDLHWADSLSLDLLSLLMEALAEAPLLLLCVYRPEREHKCWRLGSIAAQKCAERYTELPLRELTRAQSLRLVESLLALEQLPVGVREAILEKSRGNPFFLEEVVRSLIEEGVVFREGDVWRARAGAQDIPVPDSVQSVILSRVDRLTPDLKQVLQAASVIGRLFLRRLLERMAPEEQELARALWLLEERGLVYQERVVPDEEFSFKHVLTQEAVYRSLLRKQRAALHQQVGEAIEALYAGALEEHYEQLAYHYERSPTDEKAVEYLLKAGTKSERAYLNEAAAGYFTRALERLDRSALATSRKDWRLEVRKGLGRIHRRLGRMAEAEECCRGAIALGREMGLPAREIVRLYRNLADTLKWLGRDDERGRLAQEGLALLGEDSRTPEAAMMNQLIGGAYNKPLNREKFREHLGQSARILSRWWGSDELRSTYHADELRPAFYSVAEMYAYADNNIEEAMRWLDSWRQEAERHHLLADLGMIHISAGRILGHSGELRTAIPEFEQCLDLWTRIGEAAGVFWALGELSSTFLLLGDLPAAEIYARRQLEVGESIGPQYTSWPLCNLSTIALSRGARDETFDALGRANPTLGSIDDRIALARGYLASRKPEEAVRGFQDALVHAQGHSLGLARVLSGLEEALEDPEAFRAFCQHFLEEHPEAGTTPLMQWFLELTAPLTLQHPPVREEFSGTMSQEWAWHDPLGDCSFKVGHGLEIHAANGRDLWYINWSAPRLLRPASGEFAVQTVCTPATEEKPAIGGLLLWKDRDNYLRLSRGAEGEHQLVFGGCISMEDRIIGRGRLQAERVFLRLERRGDCVHALCSADGKSWFTVGQTQFPIGEPVEVGLHATGTIDRAVYPGAYPDGAAIRFERSELW